VPSIASVDLAARVRELVDRHRPKLEHLLNDELDRGHDAAGGVLWTRWLIA
jgi:hypothetical protein